MVPHNRQQQLVIWVIWFSLLVSVVIYQFALGRGIPVGENVREEGLNVFVVMSCTQVLIASLIRWILIPRAGAPGKLLVLMIIGLALSESVEFFGLFLISSDQPSTKLALWILSLVSIAQFAPIYAMSPRQTDPFRAL